MFSEGLKDHHMVDEDEDRRDATSNLIVRMLMALFVIWVPFWPSMTRTWMIVNIIASVLVVAMTCWHYARRRKRERAWREGE